MRIPGYHLPRGIAPGPVRIETFGSVELERPTLTAAILSETVDRLIRFQEDYLVHQPVERLLSISDAAVARWLDPDDPYRRLAEESLPEITGFSPPMIREGITLMLSGLRADRLRGLLKEELGDPRFLDEFLPRNSGKSRAIGPRLVAHVLAGNIPALPAAGLIASLLVKSAVLAKTPSNEPLFAVLFARTLAEIEPRLSDGIAVVGWKGGSDEARGLEEVAFRRAECVVATGDEDSIADLRRRLAGFSGTRLLSYGHRVSFGLIGREALDGLDALAESAARDVALFDQEGCLSPHLFYVETGGPHAPRRFAQALSEALARLEKRLPRGRVSTQTAASLRQFRSLYEMKQADGATVEIFGGETGTPWTVVYEEEPAFALSPLFRTVRVKPVGDLLKVPPLLSEWRPYLQAAGLAVAPERRSSLARALGSAGLNRIGPIGRMQNPPAGWHADGRVAFTELVRWVDLEE